MDLSNYINDMRGLSEKDKLIYINHVEDEDVKINLLDQLKSDSYKFIVLKNITNDELKIQALSILDVEMYKALIISTLSDEKTRIQLLSQIQNEAAKAKVIETLATDDKKLELLSQFKDDFARVPVIKSLESEDRKLELLQHLQVDDYSKGQILETITNEDLKIKGISILGDDYNKALVIMTIIDDNKKVELLQLLQDDYEKYLIIDSITDDNLIIEALSLFNDESYKAILIGKLSNDEIKFELVKQLQVDVDKAIVIESLKSEDRKLEFLSQLNVDDSTKANVINSITNENLKIQGLSLLSSDSIKAEVIGTIKNDNTKIQLLSQLQNDFDKAIVIKNLVNDEKKLELLSQLQINDYDKAKIIVRIADKKLRIQGLSLIDSDYYKVQIIISLTDDQKKYELLQQLQSDSEKSSVLKTIKNDELKIKGLSLLSNQLYKAEIISTLIDDDKKIELLQQIQSDSEKTSILKTIKNEEKKIELLQQIQSDSEKLSILKTIKNEDLKIKGLSMIDYDYYKAELIISITDDNKKVELLDQLQDDSAKASVIKTIKNEEKKIDLLKEIQNDSEKELILETITNEDLKIKGLSMIDYDYYKAELIITITDDNKKVELLGQLQDDGAKAKVINAITNEELKIKVLSMIDSEDYKSELILRLEDDEKKFELLKQLQDEDYKAEIIKALKKDKLKIIGLSFLSNERNKEMVISSLDDDQKKYELLQQIQNEDAKASILTTIKNEELKVKGLSLLSYDYNKSKVISTLTNEKLKLTAISSLTEDENKINFIREFNNEEYKIISLEMLKEDRNKFLVVFPMKSNTLKNIALKKIKNYKNVMYYFFEKGKFQYLCNFDNDILLEVFGEKNTKILTEYLKIQGDKFRNLYINYVLNNGDDLNIENIDKISEILIRINTSNSSEIQNFGDSMATHVLNSSNPIDTFNKIENVFVKNNLPLFSKVFLSFRIIYQNLEYYNFGDDSRISPQLKNQSLPKINFNNSPNDIRFNVIFNDLLRIAYRSNNRNFVEYLNNIEIGNELYLDILENDNIIHNLSSYDKEQLNIFVNHLEMLYYSTLKGKTTEIDFSKYSLIDKINIFRQLFKVNNRYDLKDRIVRTFGYSAGITSFEQLKNLMANAIKEADDRGRKYANKIENGDVFKFEQGDFVRGIGDYVVFESSLNNGNVSKEYLTSYKGKSEHDTTPLDTDFTLITRTDDIYHAISNTPTGFGFGNVFVIIKKDNPNLNITRDKDGNLIDTRYDPTKLEMFGTKGYETHWGVRTGFSFTDVDYILYKKTGIINAQMPYDENGNVNYICGNNYNDYYDLPAIKFEIARNGYYIPIIDFSGKLIFSVAEYEELREKISGLSYYGLNDVKISDNLIDDDVFQTYNEIKEYGSRTTNNLFHIQDSICDALKKTGISNIYLKFNSDLTPGSAELYSTGSTSRGTNVPGDSDYDYLVKIDRSIYFDDEKLNSFKKKLKDELNFQDGYSGKIVGTVKDEFGENMDVEISFCPRTDKIDFSTDTALSQKLTSIKEQYPEKYDLVISNIVLAKKVLKAAGVYKSAKSDSSQGGLGGIGIENWILQNGGSFVDAANSFLKVADQCSSFYEFTYKYQVFDFGSNHYSEKKHAYPHENFVYEIDNGKLLKMTPNGYEKMVFALKEFLKKYTSNYTDIDDNNHIHSK